MQDELPLEPGDSELEGAIESILLVAGGPVSVRNLAGTLGQPLKRVNEALKSLQAKLDSGIRLQVDRSEAQLVTAPEYAEVVRNFLGSAKPAPLSRAALEVLAVVAYHQPVTRSEIEAARGVNSDRTVQTLLARELIEEHGHRDTPGRPMEYITGFRFLETFGLRSLEDLPPLPKESIEQVELTRLGLRASMVGQPDE